jgi:putative multiple sugar transport system substrate-binding protein
VDQAGDCTTTDKGVQYERNHTVKMRSVLALVASAAVALSLAACAPAADGGGDAEGGLIGIAMPTRSSERWIQDGDALKAQFEEAGFTVDLQYAEDDIPTQVSQIENMVTKGAVALVVAAIDGTTLTNVLEEAASQDVVVIAYDRLLRETDAVSYYATFDNFKVGEQQAWSMLNGLGLVELDGTPIADAPAGPFNIELFAGSLDDNNAFFFFNGAWSVLNPLIEDGTLVVKSGQVEIEQVATLRWDGETAQSRMEDLLAQFYTDGSVVDGVLSPYDGISRGIISALTDAGYATGADWPIISGQDAELDSVKAIIAGEQYATIFKDTRLLAAKAAEITIAALAGDEPEINDTETYDNGVKIVPSYLLEPFIVVADNIQEQLVDSGYWTEEEING